LSPILVALLKQYDSTDVDKPGMDAVIRFAKNVIEPPVNWRETERDLCKASPIHQQVKGVFQTAEIVSDGILKDMLNKPDALLRWTPLQWAAFVGRKAEMCTLLENHADPVKLTPSRRNILHQAAESGSDEVLTSLLELGVQDQGVDIDLQDVWGETPLHVAVGRSSAAAKVLIRSKANVRLQQENGQVPLHYTRFLDSKSRGDCIRTFLELEEPGLNDRDETGKSAIFYLLDTPDCVDVLLKKGADTSILDNDGKSVLHHACAEGLPETLELFLNRYAGDGWVREDKQGDSPLHECFRHHKPECAKLLLRKTAVRPSKDRNGYNLVHHAVSMANLDVLNLVMDKYPDTDHLARTNDGETAVDILRRMGNLDREIGVEYVKRLSLSPQQVKDLLLRGQSRANHRGVL
jgi:ankyrin repeat protein